MTENNPTNQNATQSGANAPAPFDTNRAHNAPEAGHATVSEDQLAPRAYTTVFFDLDGTLLPIDTKTFMKGYMASSADSWPSTGSMPKPEARRCSPA